MPDYVWIRNWDRFQHYRDRRPPWIKTYVELLDDDTYLSLSTHRALLLHRLWLAFASSRCRLLHDTATLSRHTFLRVTTADIQALVHAGYIDIVDSPTLARRLQGAMPRARARARAEADSELHIEKGSNEATLLEPARDGFEPKALPFTHEELYTRLLTVIGNHADENTPAVLRSYVARATEGQLAKVLESVQQAHPRNRAGYAVAALRSEIQGDQ